MRKARSDRRRHSGDVVRSPVRTPEVMEPPRTPIQKSNQAYQLLGSSSPETLCPQPRRLLPDAAMSVIFGNEEAEQKELMDMFMGHKVAGAHPTRVWDCEQRCDRPLSSVSTSAGATPSLDEQCRLQFSPAPSSAAPTPTIQEPLERFKTLPPLQTQVRKVFVGGIPQWMTQEDLAAFFGNFGTVSKAWLQRQRLENGHAHSSNLPAHRGFGFVVFQDPNTVDELLGPDLSASRFLELKDGKRIEIKRAKTSTDMTQEKVTYDPSFMKTPSTPEPKGQKGQVAQWQSCSPQLHQNVSNGNNSVRETNGMAFWPPHWSCNGPVMPWFGDAKGEKMNPKPCQLEPLQEQTPATPISFNEQMASLMSALDWARSCRMTQDERQQMAKMLRAAMPDHYDE